MFHCLEDSLYTYGMIIMHQHIYQKGFIWWWFCFVDQTHEKTSTWSSDALWILRSLAFVSSWRFTYLIKKYFFNFNFVILCYWWQLANLHSFLYFILGGLIFYQLISRLILLITLYLTFQDRSHTDRWLHITGCYNLLSLNNG